MEHQQQQQEQPLTYDDIPELPASLLRVLDQAFPEKCPQVDWSARRIWIEVGRRSVVRLLWEIYEYQQSVARSNGSEDGPVEEPPDPNQWLHDGSILDDNDDDDEQL